MDIDQSRIKDLKNGLDKTLEVSPCDLETSRYLSLTSDYCDLSECNVYIVIYESTVYPSCTEGIKFYSDLITHVTDRPGHDRRYAIDASKIDRELGWKPTEDFDSGIRKTVEWYIANPRWWRKILDGSYRGERLGLNE